MKGEIRWFRKRITVNGWYNQLSKDVVLQYYNEEKKKWMEVSEVLELKSSKGEMLNKKRVEDDRIERQKYLDSLPNDPSDSTLTAGMM